MNVIDLTDKHMHFVTTCTHIDDPDEERDGILDVREKWLRETMTKGLKVKVAIDDEGNPLGFAHCLPIELGTWGMSGKDLMTIPCLTRKYKCVYNREQGSGIGRALMVAVETEARKTKKGVAVLAYDTDFWFMQSSFFKHLGYTEVSRDGNTVIMLKSWENVELPFLHNSKYKFNPISGKVLVDIFWNPLCLTSILEVHRVREVCSEFGDKVILREYNCGNKDTLDRFQISRALFINGKQRDWGYATPRDEFREDIEKALRSI